MPRNISFSMTTPQFLNGSKDVTRRMGWTKLKAGDVLQAVEKAMGLKKGEKIKPLGMIRVVDIRREKLRDMIDRDDGYGFVEARREGFPHFSPPLFVDFFCKGHKGCIPGSTVTRIEFERKSTRANMKAITPLEIWMAIGASVKEQIAEGDGFWRSCSGCHETEDGQNVHGYPHSDVFGCVLGGGCSECGGIGAVWDTTDYAAMGEELAKSPAVRKTETGE